jgi:hypothetical protein
VKDLIPERWRIALVAALVIVVAPAALVGAAVKLTPELSVLDEYAHIDYVRRVSDLEIPRIGEHIEPETVQDAACRTIAGRRPSACGEPANLPRFDAQGYQYEAQQPPLYYTVTAVLRPFIEIGPVNDFVTAARLAGIAWLASGLAVLWVAVRRLGATRQAAVSVVLLAQLSPTVLYQSATVNNDGAMLLIGGLVVLGWDALRRDPTIRRAIPLAVGAALLVLIKPMAVLPVGAAAIALVIGEDRRRRLAALSGGLVAGTAAAAYFGWNAIRDARAIVPYETVVEALIGFRTKVDSYPIDPVGSSLAEFFSTYYDISSSLIDRRYVTGVATAVAIVLLIGPTVVAALTEGDVGLRSLSAGYLAMCLIAPPLLVSQSYFNYNRVGGANERYAIGLLPITFVVTAVLATRHRQFQIACWVGVVAMAVVTVASLATA